MTESTGDGRRSLAAGVSRGGRHAIAAVVLSAVALAHGTLSDSSARAHGVRLASEIELVEASPSLTSDIARAGRGDAGWVGAVVDALVGPGAAPVTGHPVAVGSSGHVDHVVLREART